MTRVAPADARSEQPAAWAGLHLELVRFARVLVGTDDAEDVVNTAVFRAGQALGRGSVDNQRAFLYKVVTNTARNFYRAEARRRQLEVRAFELNSRPPAVPEFDGDEKVRTAIMRLSVQQRAAVFHTYWSDLAEDEVAELLGVSAGAVRRHLGRARKRLRKVLE